MAKKISKYGYDLLDELQADRKNYRSGKIDSDQARTVATLANSTTRAMRATLLSKRYEAAVAVATA